MLQNPTIRHAIAVGVLPLLAACGTPDDQPADGDPPAGTLAPAETASADPGPSFDCEKAESSAEEAVCADPALAALDREVTRLYALAETGPNMSPDRLKELRAMQRGWIKGRDDCWKADDLTQCVAASYASRIHDLRQGYADARSDDDAGISIGPLALACDDADFGVGVTFVTGPAGAAWLSWFENGVYLAQVPSGSGTKYEGADYNGDAAVLFTKGEEAMLTLPGEEERSCRIEEIG